MSYSVKRVSCFIVPANVGNSAKGLKSGKWNKIKKRLKKIVLKPSVNYQFNVASCFSVSNETPQANRVVPTLKPKIVKFNKMAKLNIFVLVPRDTRDFKPAELLQSDYETGIIKRFISNNLIN